MNEEIEVERLEFLLNSTGKKKSQLASIFGMSLTALNKYLKNKTDIINLVRKLSKLGFSIDWLLTGIGSHILPFLIDDKYIEIRNDFDHVECNNRITFWVNNYYGSVEEFELVRNIENKELQNILDYDLQITFALNSKLRNAGCNILWLITGTGSHFEDNNKGLELSKRYEK